MTFSILFIRCPLLNSFTLHCTRMTHQYIYLLVMLQEHAARETSDRHEYFSARSNTQYYAFRDYIMHCGSYSHWRRGHNLNAVNEASLPPSTITYTFIFRRSTASASERIEEQQPEVLRWRYIKQNDDARANASPQVSIIALICSGFSFRIEAFGW